MTVQPWERQEGESSKAFAAFVAYRDMGERRGYRKVVQQVGSHKSSIQCWMTQWKWQERILAYERYLDERRRRAAEKARRAMLKRHAKLAVDMQAQVTKRLKALAKTGKIPNMTPREIAKVVDVAVKVERLSRGLPTEQIEHGGETTNRVMIHEQCFLDVEFRDLACRLAERAAALGASPGAVESGGAGTGGDAEAIPASAAPRAPESDAR